MPPEMARYELYLRSKERQTDSNTEGGKKTIQAAIAEKKKQMKDAASKEDYPLMSTCVRACVSGSVLVQEHNVALHTYSWSCACNI